MYKLLGSNQLVYNSDLRLAKRLPVSLFCDMYTMSRSIVANSEYEKTIGNFVSKYRTSHKASTNNEIATTLHHIYNYICLDQNP